MSRYNFSLACKIDQLKIKYKSVIDGQVDDDPDKIANFLFYVIPFLAETRMVDHFDNRHNRTMQREKYLCGFKDCEAKKLSFVTKQVYIRHLITKHGLELPMNGDFLAPNANNASGVYGFRCLNCGARFNRKDKLKDHMTIYCTRPTKINDVYDDDDDDDDDDEEEDHVKDEQATSCCTSSQSAYEHDDHASELSSQSYRESQSIVDNDDDNDIYCIDDDDDDDDNAASDATVTDSYDEEEEEKEEKEGDDGFDEDEHARNYYDDQVDDELVDIVIKKKESTNGLLEKTFSSFSIKEENDNFEQEKSNEAGSANIKRTYSFASSQESGGITIAAAAKRVRRNYVLDDSDDEKLLVDYLNAFESERLLK
jgi:hypothetical protein